MFNHDFIVNFMSMFVVTLNPSRFSVRNIIDITRKKAISNTDHTSKSDNFV